MSDLKIFTENIEQEALDQINTLIKQPAFSDCKIRIMPDCLTEDTEILTKSGFAYIKDLSPNTLVGNYDMDTKDIFFSPVKNIIKRPKRQNEKIYEYSNENIGVKITISENHRMALKSNPNQIAKNISEFTLGELNLWGSYQGKLSCFEEYTIPFLKLLLWIVGDGSYCYSNNKKTVRVRLDVKKERKINKIKKLLNQTQIGYTIDKNGIFYICPAQSKIIYNILTEKKQYPLELLYISEEKRIELINELILIDGDYENYLKHNTYRLNTKRKSDIDFFQSLMCLTKNYSRNKKRNVKSSFIPNNEIYYLTCISKKQMIDNKNGLKSKKISRKEIFYQGQLVCVECESSYFVARQNGVVFITGNCHAGAGCVIGFTADLGDKVIPNLVGVDIGCGMLTTKLPCKDIDLEELDRIIRQYIPHGFDIHNMSNSRIDYQILNELHCYPYIHNLDRIRKSVGTLGGGNHFIEVAKSSKGELYLIVHTGSRNLGIQVAKYYQDLAIKNMKDTLGFKELSDYLIQYCKNIGQEKEIANILLPIKKMIPKIPKELCYLTGELKDQYLHDMKLCQIFATINRHKIRDIILSHLFGEEYKEPTESNEATGSFETIHNYIDFNTNILRKGAISAQLNEQILIPINMRDGSILAKGKGNPDWNNSAPHGAGRIMSRKKAKENIDLQDYKDSMKNIFTTCVNSDTLDEAPMAYKPIDEIIENIRDTVEIIDILKPIYNFKSN